MFDLLPDLSVCTWLGYKAQKDSKNKSSLSEFFKQTGKEIFNGIESVTLKNQLGIHR